MLQALGDDERPSVAVVADFLFYDERLRKAVARGPVRRQEAARIAPVMWPAAGPPARWDVPAIVTPGALAEFLGLDPGRLEWFADVQGRNRWAPDGPLRHYRYAWRRKRSGEVRIIEVPKPTLKALQRRVLDDVLAFIPPHEAAHGFRAGRSVLTFAAPHVGRTVVLRMD